jgi:carbon storage regulator
MLVLSRQKDETIMIGDDVEITVVDIRGDKVRLGIKAPPHIPVHRKEVYEAIKRENRAASQVSPDDLKSVATSREPQTQRVSPGVGSQGSDSGSAVASSAEKDLTESKDRRRNKPADSNNAKNDNNKPINSTGCEGTQPTGS